MADARDEQGEEVDNPNSTISNAGHPLVNRVVAANLFEVAEFELSDLRSLRLVCKEWCSASLPFWRRNVQVCIYPRSYGETPRPRPPHALLWETFGTELDDVITGEQPFRNFCLYSTQFLADISSPRIILMYPRTSIIRELNPNEGDPPNFEGTYRNMERFWVNYGHWIHKLELKGVYVTDVDAFKRAIFEQTPNLQELTLEGLTWLDEERERDGDTGAPISMPVKTIKEEDEGHIQRNLNLKAFAMKGRCSELRFGWRLLFNHFPNIQKLELPEPRRKRSDLEELFQILENMLMSPARRPNLPITDLSLEAYLSLDGPLQKLLRNPLVKLKVLQLHLFGTPDQNYDTLRTVMQHHGSTLKKLYLQNYIRIIDAMDIDFWESVEGPYASLSELKVKGPALAFNFHFLHKFPNLKILRLEQETEDKMLMNTNWNTLETMPHLREFYFIVRDPDTEDSDKYFIPEEILERVAEVMPNLESFTGQLTNLVLRVVCRNWGQLKKLEILSGRYFDGRHVPRGGIMDINDVGITGVVRGSRERVPCVADLQELRHLTLEHVTKIGDASVYVGFLKLPHLSSLEICETNKLTPRGLTSLKGRLQEGLTITRINGGCSVYEKGRIVPSNAHR